MSDRIRIEELHLRTVIGIDDEERAEPRDVRIDLELEVDLALPAATDRLEDSVDYRAVEEAVAAHVEGARYSLLERLAGAVADLVLDGFPAVAAVTVRVAKPGALRFARSVEVEIRRGRGA
ncbi:MAG: dihydroneopterin aldolase [Planctomycetota bacterium]